MVHKISKCIGLFWWEDNAMGSASHRACVLQSWDLKGREFASPRSLSCLIREAQGFLPDFFLQIQSCLEGVSLDPSDFQTLSISRQRKMWRNNCRLSGRLTLFLFGTHNLIKWEFCILDWIRPVSRHLLLFPAPFSLFSLSSVCQNLSSEVKSLVDHSTILV